MKSILLFSGGIDSTVLLYKLRAEGRDVLCLGFDYEQPHAVELEHAARLAQPNDMIVERLPEFMGTRRDAVNFPNRNMIFLSVAVGIAEQIGDVDTVVIGCHQGDYALFPDCRPVFLDAMCAATMAATERRVRIERPFVMRSKIEIVQEGIKLGVPFDETRSCYAKDKAPCGECLACVEREKALMLGGAYVPHQ